MKKISTKRPLRLDSETLRELNSGELTRVNGGISGFCTYAGGGGGTTTASYVPQWQFINVSTKLQYGYI